MKRITFILPLKEYLMAQSSYSADGVVNCSMRDISQIFLVLCFVQELELLPPPFSSSSSSFQILPELLNFNYMFLIPPLVYSVWNSAKQVLCTPAKYCLINQLDILALRYNILQFERNLNFLLHLYVPKGTYCVE